VCNGCYYEVFKNPPETGAANDENELFKLYNCSLSFFLRILEFLSLPFPIYSKAAATT
jgi:hypothetical protein